VQAHRLFVTTELRLNLAAAIRTSLQGIQEQITASSDGPQARLNRCAEMG